jgi:undecaprenyl diphosphate synthase
MEEMNIGNFTSVIEKDSKDFELLSAIDESSLPKHIAIIMDGNGRWAKAKGQPRIFGHREGAKSVRSVLDTCARLEIDAVTLYAFSTENWKRPEDEISGLMEMLKFYLRNELKTLNENNIRFQAIGRLDVLDEKIREEIQKATESTSKNTGTILSLALNYGGRAEIRDATVAAAKELLSSGRNMDELKESDIERHLYTVGLPEVDLMIRTSGEFRISNFLLWQLAYSEIYVTDTLFPDFRRNDVFLAILDYQKRDRRFGGIE